MVLVPEGALPPVGVLVPELDDAPPDPFGGVPVVPVAEPDTAVLAPPEADTPLGGVEPEGPDPPGVEEPPDVPVGEPELDDTECAGDDVPAGDPADDEDELDELEPLELAEPVGSAKATIGTDAIAAPTPRAIASAPTRPI